MKRTLSLLIALLLLLCFGCGSGTAAPEPTEAPTPEPTEVPTPAPTEKPESDWKTAQLERITSDESETILITTVVPKGATLKIAFPHQADYVYENAGGREIVHKVRIPIEVFLPNEPLNEAAAEIQPQVTVRTADGEEHAIACPSFSYDFPTLKLTIDSAGETEEGVITAIADADGVCRLAGRVDREDAAVTVNGERIAVYMGGYFFAELASVDGQPTAYRILAEQNNCVSAEVTVLVLPPKTDG